MNTAAAGINDILAMPKQCGWCGMIHGPRCFSVHAIEFYPDGITVKRVEFVKPTGVDVLSLPVRPAMAATVGAPSVAVPSKPVA